MSTSGWGATTERDWPEDFAHENGNYGNLCCLCRMTFAGHKRRHVCRVCSLKSEPMNAQDHQTLIAHIGWMRRMTANSRQSHGWTFDDEIAALDRVVVAASMAAIRAEDPLIADREKAEEYLSGKRDSELLDQAKPLRGRDGSGKPPRERWA